MEKRQVGGDVGVGGWADGDGGWAYVGGIPFQSPAPTVFDP